MKTNAAKTIKKFKTLTRLMSDKGGIKIRFSGEQCHTDFQSITLPVGDFNDPNYLELIEGAIDHEVGHIKWTDRKWTVKSHAEGSFYNCIRNAIEDIRMENSVVNTWPGAQFNLDRLVNQAINRGWFGLVEKASPAASVLQGVVLYYGRYTYCGQTQLKKHCESAINALNAHLSHDFTRRILAILDKIPTLKSNKDSFIMAGEIVELLKQEAQDSDDNQSGDSDDNQSGDSDDNHGGDSDDNHGGDSDDNHGGDSDDSQGGDSDDSQGGDSDDSQSGELSQFINNALSASDKDLITDLHEAVEKELAKMAHDFNGSCEEVNLDLVCREVKRKVIHGEVDYEQANKMSGLLSRELYKVIHGLNLKNTTYSSRGSSIDANRLAGVGAGNYSVFSSSRVTKAPNMAMSIVVDNSGSMGDYCMKIANTSALSLSLAIDKLKEVKSETLYYDSDDVMHLAKSFNEKAAAVKSQFAVHHHGGTITGAALYTALRRIATRPEQKKVIFLLTDGDTSFEDIPVLLSTLELAKTLNVKVVCVGILARKLGGFEDQEFLNVGNILELPRVLKKLVKANLLG